MYFTFAFIHPIKTLQHFSWVFSPSSFNLSIPFPSPLFFFPIELLKRHSGSADAITALTSGEAVCVDDLSAVGELCVDDKGTQFCTVLLEEVNDLASDDLALSLIELREEDKDGKMDFCELFTSVKSNNHKVTIVVLTNFEKFAVLQYGHI